MVRLVRLYVQSKSSTFESHLQVDFDYLARTP